MATIMENQGSSAKGGRVGHRFLLLVLLAGFVAHALLLAGALEDDTFISYRYGRNLAEGHGLVWNPGERVEGYTNFLWTLLSAGGVGVLGIEPVPWSVGLGLGTGIATMVLLFFLARRFVSPGTALLPPLLFAGHSGIVYSYVNGMETGLFTLLLLAAALVAEGARRAPLRAALLALLLFLAALTRPEGNLAAAYLFALLFLAGLRGAPVGRKRLLLAAAAFGVMNAAYLIARHGYYGSWLPNTFYAKVGATEAQLARGLDYAAWFYGGLGVPLLALILLGGGRSLRRNAAGAVLLFSALYTVYLILVGGDYKVFPRFFVPILPLLFLTAALGLALVVERVGRRLSARAVLLVAAVVAAGAFADTWRNSLPAREYRDLKVDGMNLKIDIGRWMAENTDEDALIATPTIGAIGFYSRRAVLDMHGLTDAHIARVDMKNFGTGKAGHEKGDPAYVISRRPEYVVTTPKRAPARNREEMNRYDIEFSESYDRVSVTHGGGGVFFCYRRSDLGPPPESARIAVPARGSGEESGGGP